jgi:hypothetical protein
MKRTPQLSIELIWEDNDLEELCMAADNGEFSGLTKVYFSQGEVGMLAESIRGFPKSISQQVVFEGGSEDGSLARLVFRCIDGSGHAAVRVTFVEFAAINDRAPIMNRVELELRFEALALDEFCRELQLVARREKKLAELRGTAA